MRDHTIAHLLDASLSRRRMLRVAGAAGLVAVGVFPLLAACGGDDDDDDGGATATTGGGAATATTSGGGTAATATSAGGVATPAGASPTAATGAEGVMGGIFKMASSGTPPSLDFMSSTTGATRFGTRPSIEALVTMGEDFAPTPLLAASYEFDDAATELTVTLREGVPFHNGDTLVSDDVIACMDRFLKVTTRTAAFENLDTYTAPDDQTVVFALKSPSAGFLGALAFPLAYPGIIPREVVDTISELNVGVEHLVGTGPYKAVEFVPDQILRFERFDDYASLGGPVNGLSGGKIAYFDEIQMINVPEAGGQVAGLETGEYDFADAAPTTDYDRLEESADTQTAIYKNSDLWTFYVNHNEPLIQNIKFRQALQAAIDMEEILLAITNGRKEFYTLDHSFFFPGTPWHNDEGADLYNINDPELGKKLLEESGYAGEEVILITNTTYEGIYKAVVAVDEQLKSKLGLNTKVEVLDWAGQIERTDAPSGWHIANTSFISAPTFGPGNWSQFMETGQSSWGFSNPDMDAVFDAFRAATTPEEQIQASRDIQRIQYEAIGQIKIGNTASFVALREDIKNYIHWYEPRFWSIWREA